MTKDWKKEVARDLIAFGSIPFYIIIIIRAIIGKYQPFINQLVIAIISVLLLSLMMKEANQYLARGFILVVFTSLFYKEILFTGFALLLFLGMIASAHYRKEKIKMIINGCVLGAVGSLASYYISSLI